MHVHASVLKKKKECRGPFTPSPSFPFPLPGFTRTHHRIIIGPPYHHRTWWPVRCKHEPFGLVPKGSRSPSLF
ncbi:hypothetical protein ES332_D07G260100v1 [Gossypium tomentosum]|uniref:Uncharacterized protein n=1 Tax=Gossypium tomentosum TaxID=34277 RepID=A0A5D2KBW0_GOSTO|nr:hypothetical protein ES332_D07G260100v1 [Gossypium tomentosum]